MRTLPLLALSLELAACAPEDSPCATQYRRDFNRIGLQGEAADQMVLELCDGNASRSSVVLELDRDHDGYFQDKDCNDNDAEIHPNAEEECDNVDNNCNGKVDAADPQLQDWPHFTGIATNSTTGEVVPVCCDSQPEDLTSRSSVGTLDSEGEMICRRSSFVMFAVVPLQTIEKAALPDCGSDGTHSKGLDDHPFCKKISTDGESAMIGNEMGVQEGWIVKTFVLPEPVVGDTWATRLARVAPQQK